MEEACKHEAYIWAKPQEGSPGWGSCSDCGAVLDWEKLAMRQAREDLQVRCNVWNLENAVGTVVRLQRDDGRVLITRTRSKAEVLSGHSAVVWLDGVAGCYHLDRVTPLHKLQLEYR